jgi:uncharacterized protein (TIGR00369 family)
MTDVTRLPPYDSWLGTEILGAAEGTAEVALELAPHHCNRRGVAHGGVISSVLDSALGAAVISSIPREWWCATTSLTVQFVDGARPGRLVGSGRVVRRGKSVAFATGELRDPRGRIVATATGTWHLWPYRPGAVAPAPEAPAVVLRPSGERLPVGKILAVGRNYAKHVAEMGAPDDSDPVLFLKPPSALVADGAVIALPHGLGSVHHEVELVAVIGRRGRSIDPAAALDHVLGYAVGIDLTLRDVQAEAKRRGEPWTLAKGFDGSAPVSAVVARDEVGDGSGLAIELKVGPATRQRDTTSHMLRPVAELVAFASRWITLERGDLLFTGTPAGVGPVSAGDRVEASIERIGSLTVTMAGQP